MSTHNGFLDKKGHPRIEIALRTPDGVSKPFVALIDTGFSGFVALPEESAEDLGLLPVGTVRYTVASGAVIGLILAFGSVSIGDVSYVGSIVVGNVRQPLLGIEFLRESRKALFLDGDVVLLLDKQEPGELARKLITET